MTPHSDIMGYRAYSARPRPGYAIAVATLLAALAIIPPVLGAPIPDDFPRFIVPGQEALTTSLRELFWLHYEPAGPLIPLWDEWMPMSTLWPARDDGPASHSMRARWREALAGREINAEGYVRTRQHDGPAHAEGWPFPFWMQAGGVGWHFAPIGIAGYEAPLATPEGWQLDRATGGEVTKRGWAIELTGSDATAESPEFSIAAKPSPWVRINWHSAGLKEAQCYLHHVDGRWRR